MCRTQGVLALLTLYVGLAHSFSWDIVVAGEKQLEFYDNNGTRTHIEEIPSYMITSIAYDPVHNRVLFVDRAAKNYSIASFNIATKKLIFLVRSDQFALVLIAYDPVTQSLFWTETASKTMNSIFSKHGYSNAVEQKLVIKLGEKESPNCFTVDSSGGYIYWSTYTKIERARFDGSERKVVINKNVFMRGGIAIDHQMQKMYWLDNLYLSNVYQMSVESADLNGENRRTLYIERGTASYGPLLLSKDFIYWRTYATYSQLTRNPPQYKVVESKQFLLARSSHIVGCVGMASNYKIEDQTQGIKNFEAQKSLPPNNSETNDSASLNVSTDVSLLCVHGTKVNGESRCECTQGYIGERCDVSVCHNYCFQGDCSVSAEGHVMCRCKAGYSGERCEVNACHEYCSNNGVCSLNEESEPVCQCTGGYEGGRCDVSVCQNYCLQGDCSVSSEGQPKCWCNTGYSGERCEVNTFSTPTVVTGAASYSTAIDSHIISQELNNTLKGWRIDMDHAMLNFTDDIKDTLRDWREEIEIGMSKLNDSIKFTFSDMKQEMNTLRSELEKLKESVRTVVHDVSELKSLAQFQATGQKDFKGRVDTSTRHNSYQSQRLVSSLE